VSSLSYSSSLRCTQKKYIDLESVSLISCSTFADDGWGHHEQDLQDTLQVDEELLAGHLQVKIFLEGL
jgi:hypothetical protein